MKSIAPLLLCLIILVVACDIAPQPAATATPAPVLTASVVATPSTAPTGPPPTATEMACTTPAVTGKLNLLPLPGNVLEPVAMAMLNGRLYVAGQRSNNVGVIENERLSRVIPVGSEPIALVADEASGKLFVLHSQGLLLSMLDGERVQATIPLSNSLKGEYQSASRMVGDPLSHRLYVVLDSARPDPEIVVVDTQVFTVSMRVPFNHNYFNNQMVLDTSNHQLLVADANRDHSIGYVDSLDLQSLRWTDPITMPGKGWSNFLLYDPQSKSAYTDYTETWNDHHIAAIEGGRLVSSLLIDRNPLAAQLSNGRLYLTNEYSPTLMVDLQTLQPVGTIDVDASPTAGAMLVDTQHDRLYIAVHALYFPEASRIEVVDLKRAAVANVIPLSARPRQLIADATRNRLYALMPSARTVIVSDGQRVLAHVPLERAPYQMALDEAAGKLYITEFGGNGVSVIDALTGMVVGRKPIGPGVIAVDRSHNHLLVSDRIYALDTFAPAGQYTTTTAIAPPSGVHTRPPAAVLVNPSVPRIYALGWNGAYGGNDGNIIYLYYGETLRQLSRDFAWSVTNIALDDDGQRLYATLTDIGGDTRLKVFDALNLTFISVRYVRPQTWVSAIAVNSKTHHLFLTHDYYVTTTEADDTLEVLDTRTMGHVTSMSVSAEPMALTVLGDRVYVASNTSTDLTVVRDCVMAAPPPAATSTPLPAPSPAPTTTPIPTLTGARPTPVKPIASWLTYTNSTMGYRISYPNTWYLSADDPANTVFVTSFRMQSSGHGGLPPGSVKIDIGVSPQAEPTVPPPNSQPKRFCVDSRCGTRIELRGPFTDPSAQGLNRFLYIQIRVGKSRYDVDAMMADPPADANRNAAIVEQIIASFHFSRP